MAASSLVSTLLIDFVNNKFVFAMNEHQDCLMMQNNKEHIWELQVGVHLSTHVI
jgi:hypothetical protein